MRGLLNDFITEILLADVHRLLLAISGTFERTSADVAESRRLARHGRRLVHRCHDAHVLRAGVTWGDLFKAQEMLAAVEGANPSRTRALSQRMLDVVLIGLTTGGTVTGSPPRSADVAENRPPTLS